MGIYLNPGNGNLRKSMNSEIYVDKSMLIAELNRLANTEHQYVCVSRSRRFGKTMAGNMIVAYYSKGCNSREFFDQLAISHHPSYEQYLNKLNVIQLDLNAWHNGSTDRENLMAQINEELMFEFREQFPEIKFREGDTIDKAMLRVYNATGEQFVVLIDEYDVLVREQVSERLFQSYLQFLNALFKNTSLSPAIALAYLTGILPIVRDKVQSKLNVFEEYTMLRSRQLASYFGFTSDEVRALCDRYGMSYEECCRWYDGYYFDGVGEMFNPRSLVMAMFDRKCTNNWAATGSYEAVQHYIGLNFEGIRDDVITMIGGGRVRVNITSFRNTMDSFRSKDDVFTYLLHIGYLAYDSEREECYIPNEEVRQQWRDAIQTAPEYKRIYDWVDNSTRLMDGMLNKDERMVEQALGAIHDEFVAPLYYNNEAQLQTVLGVAFFYSNKRYTVFRETPAGRGYSDLILVPYVPDVPAVVVELKRGRSPEEAIAQIKERGYHKTLNDYRGNLLIVGVGYDPDSKEHRCHIEEVSV